MRRSTWRAVAAGAAGALVLSVAPVASVAADSPDRGDRSYPAAKKHDPKKHDPKKHHGKERHGRKQDHRTPPGKSARAAVTGKAIHRHLERFQAIADANDGNRATATRGYEASARYVERTLRKAGYEPSRQYFDVETFTVLDLRVEVPGVELEPVVMSYSSSTVEDGVSGPLVVPPQAEGCDTDAWDGVDATGAIAVVSRGTCAFGVKAAVAGEVGAAAVIVHNNVEGPLNGTLGEPNPASAPAVGVTQAEGAELVAAAQAGTEAFFDLQAQISTEETFNVIAETRGGRDDNVVMLGAHLDGVEDGAGINDNASGSAAILETAVQLAKSERRQPSGHGHQGKPGTKGKPGKAGKDDRLRNKVRFAWWGAEELGLHGSTHYVSDLQENDADALADIAVYLNFDMVGSPNYVIGVYDADQSTYEAPVEVPEGSIAAEKAFTDYFDGIGQPWVDSEFSGRSDYQAFIEAGIPASGLFTGADGIKTEEEAALFGGTAGLAYDPNYHTALDDIGNVDRRALDINGRAIGEVTHQLARSTKAINGR